MPDSTINGLTAVLGNNLDQTADQLPIWVNSASTTRKISRTEFFNGPMVGALASSIRAAASNFGSVAFDGTTASTRVVSTLTSQNIGTGDFSLWSRIRVPTSSTSGNAGLVSIGSSPSNTSLANCFASYITSSNILNFRIFGASSTDYRTASISGFRTSYSGQVVDIVATRSGATLKIYINGVDTAYTETTNGTPPAWSDSVTSSYCIVGALDSSTIFIGRIFRSVVFNRALSSDDVLEVITTGISPADQWGTQTVAYTSNFTAGVDSFASVIAGAVTVTGNETAPDATTGWLKAVRFNAGTGRSDIARGSGTTGAGKRYRVTAQIYNVDCGTQWFAVLVDGGVDVRDTSPQVANGTQALVSQESVSATANVAPRIGPVATSTGSTTSGGVPSGSTYYVKNVTITRIGAIVDLDFTMGAGYQAPDRSTNALHGTLFNGVYFTVPKQTAVLYATTNTNGNQQMLGTLAIPTNAIIEDIIVNSTGTATVSIGNASAGTQIVNGASVVAGRQKLTIATPFSTTGNLWVNSNSTATLQFTILYTIAS